MAAAVTAGIIFVLMFVLIVTEKIPRHLATIGCGILTLSVVFGFCMKDFSAIARTLNFGEILTPEFWYHLGKSESVLSGINWATIFFIAGMMVMVEGMADSGFSKYLCMKIARFAHYRALRIFVAFMILSACLSMFIDSITVILFLAAITAELGLLLSFNPVPMILAEIFCANLGGSGDDVRRSAECNYRNFAGIHVRRFYRKYGNYRGHKPGGDSYIFCAHFKARTCEQNS